MLEGSLFKRLLVPGFSLPVYSLLFTIESILKQPFFKTRWEKINIAF